MMYSKREFHYFAVFPLPSDIRHSEKPGGSLILQHNCFFQSEMKESYDPSLWGEAGTSKGSWFFIFF